MNIMLSISGFKIQILQKDTMFVMYTQELGHGLIKFVLVVFLHFLLLLLPFMGINEYVFTDHYRNQQSLTILC